MFNDSVIIFLGAGDLEATHRFYHHILGLPLHRSAPNRWSARPVPVRGSTCTTSFCAIPMDTG